MTVGNSVFGEECAHLGSEVIAHFGDRDARGAVVDHCDGGVGEVLFFLGGEDLVDEDLGHAGVVFVFDIDDAGGDADFELGPLGAEVGDALGHVFKDSGTGAEKHGGDVKAVDAFFALFLDEGLEDFSGDAVEFFGSNLCRVEEGDGVDGFTHSIAQALGEIAQGEGGFGAVGAVVGDEVADFAHVVLR